MKSIWEYDKQKANIEQFLIKTKRDKSVQQPTTPEGQGL